jgi:hypothetical protein
LNNLRGNEALYVLLAAALTGVVVKTTMTTTDGSSSGAASASRATADKKPAQHARIGATPADDVPGLEPSTDVVAILRRDLGYPAGESCAPRDNRVTSLGTVIALLPDPATSGFVEELDNGLDAIMQAAQSQGYTGYRHYLPWQRDGAGAVARADAGRAGWVLMREDLPDARFRLLLILVVGERLGMGAQRAMLADALNIQQALDAKAPALAPLLILGPYFSGTADSLRDGLELWCESAPSTRCKGRRAAVISGTATRLVNAAIMAKTADLAVRFQATVNPDDALSAAMQEFLHAALGIRADHIAELTETSTAFGVAHADPLLRIAYPAHLTAGSSPSATGPAASGPEFRDGEVSIDVVPPLARATLTESAQVVASTIESLRRQGITDLGVLATSSADKMLLVTALRAAAPDIRPHVYEANLTLADPAQHGAMDGTLAASSYPVAAVTQLWAGRPNVQPFTSDAAEGIYNALLALLWEGRLITDDVLAAGLRDYRLPFGGPDVAAARTERIADLDRVGPPIWISVIVDGRVWPLAVYQFNWELANGYVFGRVAHEGTAQMTTACPAPGAAPPPDAADAAYARVPMLLACAPQPAPRLNRGRFATVALVLLLVVVVGNLLGLARPFRAVRRCPFLLFYEPKRTVSRRTVNGCDPESFFCLDVLRDSDARPAVWLGTLVLSLIGLAAGLLYEFPLFLTNSRLGLGDVVAAALIICSFVLLASPFFAHPQDLRAGGGGGLWQRLSHQRHWLRWLVHGGLVFGAGVAATWALVHFTRAGARSDGRAFFFFARLMNPSLGLTPALPLGVMAAALYAACLFRLRVVRRGRRLLASASQWTGEAIPGAEAGMRAFAQASLCSMERVLWAGAVVGMVLYAWHRVRPRSLEGSSFDFVVAVGFGLTFAVAIASMWRADRLWRMLARYLRALAIHPWSAAFSTMPSAIGQAFHTPMPGRLRHDEVERAYKLTARLVDANPLGPAPGDGANAAGPPPIASRPASHSVAAYLTALEPWWKATGVRPPALGPADPELRPLSVQLREHALALRMTEALSQMCDATRTTLFIGSASAVAAVVATALYPFQPAGTLAWAARITIAIVVLVAMRVIGGIERDEVLSHIAGTDPGKVTPSWSLAMRVIGYVIVPLATLTAAHLPDHGLLSGLLRALNGASSVVQP